MNIVLNDRTRKFFGALYGSNDPGIEEQILRYRKMISNFQERFNKGDIQIFSAPGRTEIGGNHTDHNGGRVLAGSVHLDSIAAVTITDSKTITVYSEGYTDPFIVHTDDLKQKKAERGSTNALLRGIAARFRELGYTIGGFNAFVASDVGVGSGLSSSASIEVLLGTILNTLFNAGKVPDLELAKIGRFSENHFFGKPCGLMDQIACLYGGILSIDFADEHKPVVQKMGLDFMDFGLCLLVVNTGSDHADLTEEYASIPRDMKLVAAFFGASNCRELPKEVLLSDITRLRQKVSDRAILRAYHFLAENERVSQQVEALQRGDIGDFLNLVQGSGDSSAKWLQNSFSTRFPLKQPLNLALALTDSFFSSRHGGAYRVHGGGFAGTILVFTPNEYRDEYIRFMEAHVGKNRITQLRIRSYGAMHMNSLIGTL
jgi:galactokinase